MKKIAIDTVSIFAGHGGSGGGIWTYTKQLLLHLDKKLAAGNPELKVCCLVNKEFPIELEHIEIVRFGFNTKSSVVRMFFVHLILPAFCFKHKINLLHKLTTEIPLFSPCKVVATVHDFMMEFYEENGLSPKKTISERIKSHYFKHITKHTVTASTLILTPSESIKKEIISRFGITAQKITVTHLASERPKSREVEIKKTGPYHLFCIAAFHPHKGHLSAIQIVEILIQQLHADVHLYLRGNVHDKVFYQKVLDTIASSPCKERMHVVGFDKSSTLTDIYSKADFVVLLSQYEGFGLPILEAQAYGIPVICSSIPTSKELGEGSVCFVDPLSPLQSAESILRLIYSTEEQYGLIEKGRSNCAKYTWELLADKTYLAYVSAVN